MLAPQRVMEIALKRYGVRNKSLRSRYSEMLVARAVRFYLENNLDTITIEEDLYHGQDFDCTCTQEDADRNVHKPSCEYAGKEKYVNLTHGEKHEREWQREHTKFN